VRGRSKRARKAGKAAQRKVLSILSEWPQGLIALINLRDGIDLGHLDHVPYEEFLDRFVLDSGGESCALTAENLYWAFRQMVFDHAKALRFGRKPPPIPTTRICVVLDKDKLKETQKDKDTLDAIFDEHGDTDRYPVDYAAKAKHIVRIKALEGGLLAEDPCIFWASCHDTASRAIEHLPTGKRASETRNLLGLDNYPTKAVLFMIDIPFPSGKPGERHFAGPTVFEQPGPGRFKARYDDPINAANHWGRTANLGRAYDDQLAPHGADGLPEIVLRPISISEDFKLEFLGVLENTTPGSDSAHARYLLLSNEPYEIVEALVV
jgi:hypothetical protein